MADEMCVTVGGIALDVTYSASGPCRGARDKWGVPLEPDYPASVEVISVFYGGEDFYSLLSSKVIYEIEAKILEKLEDDDGM